jgi:myosin heavy subunit
VPKLVKEKFSIVHTPKEVTYMIAGFRGKNKDEISKDLERGVTSSANESIVRFWRCLLEDEKADDSPTKGSTKENKFLSAKFRKQMKDLMEELQSCDVHFIRCIKPNEIKKKDFYLNSYVLL